MDWRIILACLFLTCVAGCKSMEVSLSITHEFDGGTASGTIKISE